MTFNSYNYLFHLNFLISEIKFLNILLFIKIKIIPHKIQIPASAKKLFILHKFSKSGVKKYQNPTQKIIKKITFFDIVLKSKSVEKSFFRNFSLKNQIKIQPNQVASEAQ